MKTWTNPTVEELDVKLTASMNQPFYHENNNGYYDGNTFWGAEGDDNEEGTPETAGPNS